MQILMNKDFRITQEGSEDEILYPKDGTYDVTKDVAIAAALAGATTTKSAVAAAKKVKAKSPSKAAQKNNPAISAAAKKIDQLETDLAAAKDIAAELEKGRDSAEISRTALNNKLTATHAKIAKLETQVQANADDHQTALDEVIKERNTAIEAGEKLAAQVTDLTAALEAATAPKSGKPA